MFNQLLSNETPGQIQKVSDSFISNNWEVKQHHIPGAFQAIRKFANGYEMSVVSGPAGCGLYGDIDEGTYEVAIFRPNGNMTDDVIGWRTEQEVFSMEWVLSQL
jgi:hypothetical protein